MERRTAESPRLAAALATPLRLFTIAIELRGSVHVHQLSAADERQALVAWSATLDFPDLASAQRRRWRRAALHEHWFLEERPVPITGTEGVFCAGVRLGRHLALLNLIETPTDARTRPTSGNGTHTLVVDYRGGTHIGQHRSPCARAALLQWLERAGPDVLVPRPSLATCARAERGLRQGELEPQPVEGCVHVHHVEPALGRGPPAIITLVRTRTST